MAVATVKDATAVPPLPPPPHRRDGYTPLADRLNPKRAGFDPAFQLAYKAMSKAERKALARDDAKQVAALKARGSAIAHAFITVADDHCETPPNAYADVTLILDELARRLGKDRRTLAIWDPYFCAGAVVRHLGKLGFVCVRNENVDAYASMAADPAARFAYDVLLTNPPYSGDHVERLCRFVAASGKPSLLLVPDYFARRAFYPATLGRVPGGVAYLVPSSQYAYWTPEGLRGPKRNAKGHRNLALGVRTSPFASSWHLCLGPVLDTVVELLADSKEGERLRERLTPPGAGAFAASLPK